MRAEFSVWGMKDGEKPHYVMFSTEGRDAGKEAGGGGGEVGLTEAGISDGAATGTGEQEETAPESNDALATGEAVATGEEEAGQDEVPSAQAEAQEVPAEGGEGALPQEKKKGRRRRSRQERKRDPKPRPPRVEVTAFPVGSRLINELMPVVMEACGRELVLKKGLFQVDAIDRA